jgi:hypothetical protein
VRDDLQAVVQAFFRIIDTTVRLLQEKMLVRRDGKIGSQYAVKQMPGDILEPVGVTRRKLNIDHILKYPGMKPECAKIVIFQLRITNYELRKARIRNS